MRVGRVLGGLVLGLCVLGLGAGADEAPASLDDAAALGAWMDGVMEGHLEAYHIAGAVVAVVKDGQVIFSKGYGYADVDERTPVDPSTTMFRIGSVSKLFVWTSVMQLVQAGKIDLDADVNTYLRDLQIPERFNRPITMKDLMTHEPGFEDQVIGLFSHDPDSIQPLSTILRREMPARVRPPGQAPAYSNHGTALAMHVVEELTNTPWEGYVSDHILEPLGMTHTVLKQPVPAPQLNDLSSGYRYANQVFEKQEFELIPLGPVGGITTTALDMATFMEMYLANGTWNGAEILEADTAKRMQTPLRRLAPGANAMNYGFIDLSERGVRVSGHGGDTLWFHTLLALFPDRNVGLFVSYNTDTGAQARDPLLDEFVKRFFAPEQLKKPEPPADFEQRAQQYVGAYRTDRYSYRSFAKLAAVLGPMFVSYDGHGALRLSATGAKRWIEVEPNVFQEENGPQRIVFYTDSAGKVKGFAMAQIPVFTFERVGFLGNPLVHLAVFAATVLACLIALIAWPWTAIVRTYYSAGRSPERMIPIAARILGWVTVATTLVFIGGFLSQTLDPMKVVFGIPPILETLLTLPLVIAGLTLIMAIIVVILWIRGRGTVFSRLMYSALTLILCAFLWQAIYWNLTVVQNQQIL